MKKLVKVFPFAPALGYAGSAFAAVPKNIKIGTDPIHAPFESKNASSPITSTLDSLRGKCMGVLQGSTQELYANAM